MQPGDSSEYIDIALFNGLPQPILVFSVPDGWILSYAFQAHNNSYVSLCPLVK